MTNDFTYHTDVTTGTTAMTLIRFYNAERQAYRDAAAKMKLFAQDFIDEMKRGAEVPVEFRLHTMDHLSDLLVSKRNGTGSKDDHKELLLMTGFLFDRMFGDGFAKLHKVKLENLMFHGYKRDAVNVIFTAGNDTYLFYIPFYDRKEIWEKGGADGGYINEYDFRFKAWVRDPDSTTNVESWEFLDGKNSYESYDWKKVCDAIAARIVSMESEE